MKDSPSSPTDAAWAKQKLNTLLIRIIRATLAGHYFPDPLQPHAKTQTPPPGAPKDRHP